MSDTNIIETEQLSVDPQYTLSAHRAATRKTKNDPLVLVGRVQTQIDALEREYEAKINLLRQAKSDALVPFYNECISGAKEGFVPCFWSEYYSDTKAPAYARRVGDEYNNYYDLLWFDGKHFRYEANKYINQDNILFPGK